MRAALALLVACLLSAAPAPAADQQILGKRFLLRDPTGAIGLRQLRVTGRESSTDIAALVGNPVADGATLRVVVKGASTGDETYTLPAEGWRATATGFRFTRFPGFAEVRSLVLKRTPSGTVVLRVLAIESLSMHLVPPNPGTESGVALQLNGGDTYCVSFGGAAGGRIGADTATTWRVSNATVQPGCITPAAPSCCSEALAGCWFTRSTAICADLGNDVGPAASVCDSVTGGCIAPPAAAGACCEDLPSDLLSTGCSAGGVLDSNPEVCTLSGGTLVPNSICTPSGTCASPSGAFLEPAD
jgi:hypothetical protein